jgi:hypothetical protein
MLILVYETTWHYTPEDHYVLSVFLNYFLRGPSVVTEVMVSLCLASEMPEQFTNILKYASLPSPL